MKNKLLKRLLAVLMLLALMLSLCACGNDFDLKEFIKKYMTDEGLVSRDPGYIETLENELYQYEVYEDHVMLTGYIGEANEVILPSSIDGLPVTVIGSLCFYNGNSEVTNVTIPSSVKRLDDSAFYLCNKLEMLVVPETVERIGERCFGWCESLKSITLPSSLTEIPAYCFNYCVSLETINIPSVCTKIGTRAFSYCSALTTVTLPLVTAEIGAKVFAECESLDFLLLPDSLKVIGDGLLDGSDKCLIIASASSTAAMYCDTNSLTFYTTLADAEAAKGYGDPEQSDQSDQSDG